MKAFNKCQVGHFKTFLDTPSATPCSCYAFVDVLHLMRCNKLTSNNSVDHDLDQIDHSLMSLIPSFLFSMHINMSLLAQTERK